LEIRAEQVDIGRTTSDNDPWLRGGDRNGHLASGTLDFNF
jgi:hypothetical protein